MRTGHRLHLKGEFKEFFSGKTAPLMIMIFDMVTQRQTLTDIHSQKH